MKNRSESSVGLEPAEEIYKTTTKQNESWNRRLLLWNYLLRTTIALPSTNPFSKRPGNDEEFLDLVEEKWGSWKREIVRRKMMYFPLLDPEIGGFILKISLMKDKEKEEELKNVELWILDEITDQELIEL